LKLRSGKTLWVRAFDFDSDADYARVVAVENAIDPDHADSVENWQHWDRNRNPEHHFRRFVAERDGEVVAFGHYGHQSWSFREDKYFFWVGVHPDHERKGYGSALWDYMLARLSKREPGELVSWTRENRPRAVEFLEHRGFEAKLRMPISRINPQTFDPAPFAEKIARTWKRRASSSRRWPSYSRLILTGSATCGSSSGNVPRTCPRSTSSPRWSSTSG
jgi:ribosomal protein S18 acetylase RimI-like enzyme